MSTEGPSHVSGKNLNVRRERSFRRSRSALPVLLIGAFFWIAATPISCRNTADSDASGSGSATPPDLVGTWYPTINGGSGCVTTSSLPGYQSATEIWTFTSSTATYQLQYYANSNCTGGTTTQTTNYTSYSLAQSATVDDAWEIDLVATSTRYQIVRRTGDDLFFGATDSTYDATTAAKRPVSLRTDYYWFTATP